MALKKWRGGAQALGQVTRITFSAYTSGQTYTLTINGKSVSYTATASLNTNVWDGLVLAWQGSTEREFAEVTPSTDAGVLLTSVVIGMPFTVSATATGGITATIASVTAASGPNSLTTGQNWVGGTAPAAGDDLLFADSEFSVLYDLEDTSNDYGDITVDSSFAGSIGLPPTNTNGYQEYRPRFLKLGTGSSAYALTIGLGVGRQPERVLIDANGADIALTAYGTGQSSSGSEYPMVLKNTGSGSVVNHLSGRVQIDADSSGSLAAVNVTPAGQSNQGATLLIGATVAAGNVVVSGGSVELRGTATSLQAINGASVEALLDFACPTVTIADGASVLWRSTGNIATKLTVQNQGRIDFSGQGDAKAVQACDLYAAGTISDPLAVVTWTTGVALKGCSLVDVELDLGRDQTIQTI